MARFNEKEFNPMAFGKYVENVPKLRTNALIRSRAIVGNDMMKNIMQAQTGTAAATIPLYGNLDGAPVNYDGKTDITSTSTTTYAWKIHSYGRAKAWTEMDFAEDITGGAEFMNNVGDQVSSYWEDQTQETMLSILKGIFAMTGAENKKFVDNHTLDISGKTGEDKDGNPLNCVGAATLNTAAQKACGDNKSKFSLIVMHSVVATNLENMRLLQYLKYTDKDGIQHDLTLGTWNGRTVLVDDNMPVETSGTGDAAVTNYTSYLLGAGAFAYANLGAEVPYEMQRDPKTKGGQVTLYTRRREIFAPRGISFISESSLSPMNADFENGANWSLVNDGSKNFYDHKGIMIARIISRG